MNGLVTYYSRTGNTEQVGKQIAEQLGLKENVIEEHKEWKGKLGILRASLASLFRRESEITVEEDVKDYDLAIIGTPVWAGHIPPAVRSYLSNNGFNQVAFFCTFRNYEGHVLEEMEQLTTSPVATLAVKEDDLPAQEHIKDFCSQLK